MYPNPVIDPHFHDVDQFQVVVAGDGRMGKQKVAPITFQYADAYTPYGPIVGNDDGISFFTLRPIASGGHWVMPGNRDKMPGPAGRNIAGLFDHEVLLTDEGKTQREALMDPQEDGVDAVGFRFGPNAECQTEASTGGGQYILVCSGTIERDGKIFEANSLMHVEAGEDAPTLRSGKDGANVLVMQFARPSERPGSNPAEMAKRDPKAYVEKEALPGQKMN
ncbi:MAG TPA: hypothetical protein DCS82_10415 [Rhodospirillaceae bacterium]|nr:hypothetical protein [Rhodospirillaceae bacterium]HAT36121.1 hypothetical protein [Rhodospirillaceae bacterium]